jgi:hypothetical protein
MAKESQEPFMNMHALPKRWMWGWIWVCIVITAGISWGEWINVGSSPANEPVTATVIYSDETATEFTVSVNRILSEDIIIEGVGYSRLLIPGESATWRVGFPELPKVVKLVAVPPTGNVELTVEAGNVTVLENISVPPAQENDLRDVMHQGEPLVFDDAAYGDNAFYPASLAQISQPMIARDLRVVAVTMYPVQYNPITRQLRIYSELSISLQYTGGSGVNQKQVPLRRLSKAMMPFYRAEVINFDQLGLDDPGPQSGTLLIICRDDPNVLIEVNKIAEWKRKKGFNTVAATSTQTGTSSSTIHDYIQDMYTDPTVDPPLEYVMMVGDASGSYGMAAASSTSDYGYSLLEGGDIIAEVSIGRLSFSSLGELRTIRAKILGYESNPYMGGSNPDWFQDAWMYAGTSMGVTSTIHTKEYVRELLYGAGYHQILLDTHGSSVSETLIRSRLNAGVSIWNHRPAWVGEIYCSHVDELNNGWMLPVCLNLTCGTGDFVGSDDVSECLLRGGNPTTPNGAIGAIATATLGTHTAQNNAFDGAFFHALISLGQYHVGDALSVGKAHFMWQYQGSSSAQNYCYWNNLMGDPSVEVWTTTPELIHADFPATMAVGTNTITVAVENASSQPVEGAYVHAYKHNETFVGDVTDASGQVTLPISATTADTLFITITGHTYKPVVGYALVQTSAHNVAPINVVIDDDNTGYSQGNNNGEPNPGEALEINVTLKNWGYQSVTGVSATMSTTDPHVTSIDNATVYYGSIGAGGQVTPSTDFELTLSPTIPDRHQIQLSLEITDNTLTTYDALVVLDIQEINLDYVDHDWLNAGNGIFDPGETVNLQVTLLNKGQVDAPSGITATASVNHPQITVLDPTGTYPAIPQGASATNTSDPIQIQADSYLYAGTPFQVTLTIQHTSGFRDTVIFNDTLGTTLVTDPLGPDAYGYYAFDNGDTPYSKRPSYLWVEIDPGYGGNGTVLDLPDYGENQDASVMVTLPFSIQFYRETHSRITVCSNGWLAFGDQSNISHAENWRIPGALGAMSQVSAVWDDYQLYTSGDGRVWKYYDSANHRLIIEWSRVYNRGNGNRETFEVIIFDESYYPTPTNDAEILIQCQTVTSGLNASVGIDNQDQSIGMEYYFNNHYPTPALPPTSGRSILFTTDPGTRVGPPIIVVNPLSVTTSAEPGGSAQAEVTISNVGESTLDYSILVTHSSDSQPASIGFLPTPTSGKTYIPSEPKGASPIDATGEVTTTPWEVDDSGGPDEFGYVWVDSDEPGGPEYQWIDITSSGTTIQWQVDPDDESFGPINIGFDFPFYGNDFSTLRICSNGFISFTDDSYSWSNSTLPNSGSPANLIAIWWDDLNPEHGGEFYYWSNQVDTFIVTVDSVQDWRQEGIYTFQAILTGSGHIRYQYQSMGPGRLDEETIGIQNGTRTIGLTVAYNTPYVHDQLAVEFYPPLTWLAVEPQYGTVEPSQTDTLHLTMDGSGLEIGTYQANMTVSNNDLTNPQVVVPVTFTIGGAPVPPAAVDDLEIAIVGDHITLDWSPVTENVNGEPITVSSYNIYSGSNPNFTPAPGNQIGSTTETNFMHTNALQSATSRFYIVTAVL